MLKCSTGGSLIRKMSNLAEDMAKEHGSDKIQNFSLGNPRVPPPKEYFDALREIANTETPLCHGYSSTVGDLEPREAFAALFTKLQGVEVKPDHIVLTSGCAGAMNVTLRVIMIPGDEIILITPYFLEYPFYVENFHGTIVEVNTTFEEGWQINPKKLEAAISPMTRAVIINSPHNPTGVVYTQQCIDEMSAVLKRKSEEYGRPIYILSDDVYARLVEPGVKPHQIFKSYEYSVVCYSLSKDLSIPGERFGCMVGNPLLPNVGLLIHCLAHANEIMGFVHANRLHMRIVPKVLPASSQLALYDKSRAIVCKMLDDCGIEYVRPQGAFYVFPKIPDGIDEWAFCEMMAKKMVILVPGLGFKGPGFFRMSFCKPPEDIEKAVPVFKTAFRETIEALAGK
jgi:aspartate aminotransferase